MPAAITSMNKDFEKRFDMRLAATQAPRRDAEVCDRGRSRSPERDEFFPGSADVSSAVFSVSLDTLRQ
jgi:hypothetical protein